MLYSNYHTDELKRMPIKLLASAEGLSRDPWSFDRGGKTERCYKDQSSNPLIRVYYTYIYSNGVRDIESFQEFIEFKKENGEVFLTIEVPNSQSSKVLHDLNRVIRQGRIDYLETTAKALGELAPSESEPWKTNYETVSNNIDTLFDHYQAQIDEYISRGTMSLENAVNSETDQSILDILNTDARKPDADFPNGLTVKQSIMYQLEGSVP